MVPGLAEGPHTMAGGIRIAAGNSTVSQGEGINIVAFEYPHRPRFGRTLRKLKQTAQHYIRERIVQEHGDADGYIKQMNDRLAKMKRIPRETKRRMYWLIGIMESLRQEKPGFNKPGNIQRIQQRPDVIARSQALDEAALAPFVSPGTIENVIGIDGAGMIGRDNSLKLMARSVREFIRPLFHRKKRDVPQESDWKLQAASVQLQKDNLSAFAGIRNIFRNILKRPFGFFEGIHAIARTQVDGYLPAIREEGHKVAVIHAERDGIFPYPKVLRRIRFDTVRDGLVTQRGTVDEFEKVPGDDHHGMFNNARFMELATKFVRLFRKNPAVQPA
jgi:hypothetical protein